jgi:hypothetical protein
MPGMSTTLRLRPEQADRIKARIAPPAAKQPQPKPQAAKPPPPAPKPAAAKPPPAPALKVKQIDPEVAAQKAANAAENEAQSRRYKAGVRFCRDRLPRLYPDLFNIHRPKPLAIGIHTVIRQRFWLSNNSVSTFMNHWVGMESYLEALIAGDVRYNLDGTPAQPIDEAGREVARRKLAAKRARVRGG